MNGLSYSIIYSACLALLVNCASAQNVYIVGDSIGWTVPPNTSFYSNWASSKAFMVGDILEFNFTNGEHNVVRVPKASYDICSTDGTIGNVTVVGPAKVTLDSAGDHYYISSIGIHCESGQKLSITVTAPPPPMTTPPPPTTPNTTSPEPPKSGSPPRAGPTPPPPPMTTPPPPTTPNTTSPEPPKAGSPPSAGPTPPPPPMPSSSVSMGGSFLIITMCAALANIV